MITGTKMIDVQAAGVTQPWPKHGSRNGRRIALQILICSGLILLGAWIAYLIALRSSYQSVALSTQRHLDVEAVRLEGQLSRYEYLPTLLEEERSIIELLLKPDDARKVEVGLYLKNLNAIAGTENIYVLDPSGQVLTAADFQSPYTPAGQSLAYRPYLQDALSRGRGRFYGVGIMTNRPGYFLSYGLSSGGNRVGVATVKVPLETLETEWLKLPGTFLLTDVNDVIILSTRAEWKYRPLRSLPEAVVQAAVHSRQYGAAKLEPLDVHEEWLAGPGLLRLDFSQTQGTSFVGREFRLNNDQWRLIALAGERDIGSNAWLAASAGAAGGLALYLIGLLAFLRRRNIRMIFAQRAALHSANETLEAKVAERTRELRETQNDLIHAGKLTVLGQMSAGIVHELNQPLAAIQTAAENAVVLMERQRITEAKDVLGRIGALVDRLARLTRQLKGFAHRSDGNVGRVELHQAINNVLWLYKGTLRQAGIEMDVQLVPVDIAVRADAARLEQVIGNLVVNFIDALRDCAQPRITIRAYADGSFSRIILQNNGPKIEAASLSQLFEPFFTTKPPGDGLGLGLPIAAHITKALGGQLTVQNLATTGVEFCIELPLFVSEVL